uniref:Uncharacterized protein n=1 Tax=Glossina palpalis gambiensis TaxID=67801 RepID=A0A1B0C4F1_9MUSC
MHYSLGFHCILEFSNRKLLYYSIFFYVIPYTPLKVTSYPNFTGDRLSMDVNQKPIHYLSRGGYEMVFINQSQFIARSWSTNYGAMLLLAMGRSNPKIVIIRLIKGHNSHWFAAPRNFEQVNDLSACLSVKQPASQLANQPASQPWSSYNTGGEQLSKKMFIVDYKI